MTMETILGHINNAKLIYAGVLIVSAILGSAFQGYITIRDTYTNILTNIETNRRIVETTQITMLKSIVREFERAHVCNISNAEWDEYMLNYSTLFDLKVRYKILSERANWKPTERIFIKCNRSVE